MFLKTNDIELSEGLSMAESFLRGLHYLHVELIGTQRKPGMQSILTWCCCECFSFAIAIAHRDLKSRNILVKDNLQLCIADLGLAIVGKGSGVDVTVTNKFSGTRRYMSPELLNRTMDFTTITSFKQSDIYSASLCIWEIMNAGMFTHTIFSKWSLIFLAITKEYHQPYYLDLVNSNPSIEDVKTVVVDRNVRPTWKSDTEVSLVL